MSNHSREKVALLVFAGLIVLSLLGFSWYLLAGHSWNVAASNIDDTFGSMDDYVVMVYPGTQAVAVDSKNERDDDAPRIPPPADSVNSLPEAPDTPVSSTDAPETLPDSETATDGTEVAAGALGVGGGELVKKKPLSVEEVRESYDAKKASVFALDTQDLAQYREGIILKKNNHRFGVFSVEKPLSSIVMEKHLAYFKRYKVDFIVVLTVDKSYVEDLQGIDIAICTQDEGLYAMGETNQGTFFVNAPEVGKVGAILISPSNVVSAKVIESL